MGQVLHGSATTTEAVRRAIHHSQESLRVLAKRYGINPKTVAKSCTSSWRSTGQQSSPSSNCTRRPPPGSPASSCAR